MSEQPKKKGLSTSIIVCIICAGILAAATALAIRSVVKTQQENESRQQSMVDASESMFAASNDEETRLLNAVTDVCKKHNIAAHVKLNKNVHEPHSQYSFEESTEDPIKYEIDISLQIDPPEKIKDWTKFYYFLDELESVQPTYPFIELSVKPYYIGEYVSGSGQSYELSYSSNIGKRGLISVSDGREVHYIGMKTNTGINPISEILPYAGMPEALINSTKLGKATSVDINPLKCSKYYWKIPYYAEKSEPLDWQYAYYQVYTGNGVVEYVLHAPEYETVPKPTSSSGGSSSGSSYRPSGGSYRPSGNRPVTTTKKAYYDDDPYNARDFNDPEDFYDYYYDDFEDYEEAYDYFYEHNPD